MRVAGRGKAGKRRTSFAECRGVGGPWLGSQRRFALARGYAPIEELRAAPRKKNGETPRCNLTKRRFSCRRLGG